MKTYTKGRIGVRVTTNARNDALQPRSITLEPVKDIDVYAGRKRQLLYTWSNTWYGGVILLGTLTQWGGPTVRVPTSNKKHPIALTRRTHGWFAKLGKNGQALPDGWHYSNHPEAPPYEFELHHVLLGRALPGMPDIVSKERVPKAFSHIVAEDGEIEMMIPFSAPPKKAIVSRHVYTVGGVDYETREEAQAAIDREEREEWHKKFIEAIQMQGTWEEAGVTDPEEATHLFLKAMFEAPEEAIGVLEDFIAEQDQ